jgi:hypothetical protein
LSPEPRALNYSKNHMNQLRHLLLLLPSLSQVATGSRGINHTGGPILDSNLAPLDSSPVISTQPRTQLWPSTSPSTLPYILHWWTLYRPVSSALFSCFNRSYCWGFQWFLLTS